MVMKKLLSLVTCVWIVSTAGHEIFSSTDQVMQLVEEERNLLHLFNLYINAEEENLNTLKALHKTLTNYSNSKDSKEIMSDPAAAYKLIRWLRYEWLSIVNSTQDSLYEVFQNLLQSDVLKIPSNADLEGAASGLIRLQEIYKLYPEDIIEDPTNDEVRHLLKLYRTLQEYTTSYYPNVYKLSTKSHNSYEALCRGNVHERTSRRQRALSCRYSTGGGNPRLILAPLKEEVEWNEPRIIRYHDIISDEEIEILKNLSRPLLSRSRTKSGISNIRVSQSVFLDEDDTVVVRVNQRVADATGLSMETAETLHVQNYGIGGRYEPHYDAGYDENERIATFLIYMSDVKIGGATVFPKVGVALQPIKGSAVFWYNLEKNGDLDLRSKHAGCPVLVGNKWVANKWIHEFGQEFRRPCSLSKWE